MITYNIVYVKMIGTELCVHKICIFINTFKSTDSKKKLQQIEKKIFRF